MAGVPFHYPPEYLSIIHLGLGEVLLKQGDSSSALESYERALEIRIRHADADPTNAESQRELAAIYQWIAVVYLAKADKPKAREAFESGRARLARAIALSPDHKD